jgi:hypothetical protein
MWGQPSSAVRRAKRAILHLTRSPVILSAVEEPAPSEAEGIPSCANASAPRGIVILRSALFAGEAYGAISVTDPDQPVV